MKWGKRGKKVEHQLCPSHTRHMTNSIRFFEGAHIHFWIKGKCGWNFMVICMSTNWNNMDKSVIQGTLHGSYMYLTLKHRMKFMCSLVKLRSPQMGELQSPQTGGDNKCRHTTIRMESGVRNFFKGRQV